ncbi:MAG: NUDIX domain-containing protein [Muribaculaceae bacterium]|nr:NUDIX domain-containing protein [Muribaculaceae bacterium]
MEFSFCPDCGARLERRDLGDEKGVAWCESCGRPWFAVFPVAVIALVYNDSGEVLLLRQNYISTEFHNLVSGYVKPGEDAESCVVREIKEETGLEVDRVRLIFTDWFAKKEMMMIGFFAHAACSKLELSSEVDSAEWVEASLIKELLSPRPGSTSRRLALCFLNEREA